MEQWEGGIRVNGWVSGGFLPEKVRGTKYEGLACGWDWCKCWAPSTTPVSVTIALLIACLACACVPARCSYLADGTFSELAGIDPTDWRAAAASLPPVDSHSLVPVLMGTGESSRKEIPIGTVSVAYNKTRA